MIPVAGDGGATSDDADGRSSVNAVVHAEVPTRIGLVDQPAGSRAGGFHGGERTGKYAGAIRHVRLEPALDRESAGRIETGVVGNGEDRAVCCGGTVAGQNPGHRMSQRTGIDIESVHRGTQGATVYPGVERGRGDILAEAVVSQRPVG